MAKLYYKYGAMGSSKSAQALMTKFNYEEKDRRVWLIKPAVDNRGDARAITSRVGLRAEADVILPDDDLFDKFMGSCGGFADVIIADETQFFTPAQIDALRRIVDELDIPVLCFGLRTDFRTVGFPGSIRLFELADSITEIKTICACGRKAIVNARRGPDGNITVTGEQVFIGGNESYEAMCHKCWKEKIRQQRERA